MARKISLVYFAWVRERLGRDGDELELPVDITTVTELIAHLSAQDASYHSVFDASEKIRFALDQQFVQADASLGEAVELAIFPPVTGG